MWTGWYEQDGQQHPVKFQNFKANPQPRAPISGDGVDEIGQFVFDGSFNDDGAKVRFKKQYTTGTKHAIYYQGDVNKSLPGIRGYWGFAPGNQDGRFEITLSK